MHSLLNILSKYWDYWGIHFGWRQILPAQICKSVGSKAAGEDSIIKPSTGKFSKVPRVSMECTQPRELPCKNISKAYKKKMNN